MEAYLSIDGLRACLVLLLAIGQVVMAYLPQLLKWPETVPSRSARLQNPVVPVEWAFAIWGPIFLGCIGFGIWQALPGQLQDGMARGIGWVAAAVFALNMLWEWHVPRRGFDVLSVVVILAEWALLVWIVLAISHWPGPWDAGRVWLAWVPWQVLAGWVTAAAFVNAATVLQARGVAVGTGASIATVLAAGVVGGAVAWATGGWAYAAALCWALFGIAVANVLRAPNRAVAAVATAAIPAVLLAVSL